MKHALLSFAIGLAGCSDLPTFADEGCGNFVLEPGEDCDDGSSGCQQCRLLCGVGVADDDGDGCAVDGYTCGVDGLCHAASGAFGASTAVPFRGGDVAITDVDGDAVPDVLASGDNVVTIHHGSPAGLRSGIELLAPFARGYPHFAHLDADGSLDLLIPTADGIAGYSAPEGVVAPHAFAFQLDGNACPNHKLGDPFHVFSLDDDHLGVLTAYDPPETPMPDRRVGLAVIKIADTTACPDQAILPMCGSAAPANVVALDVRADVVASTGKVGRDVVVAVQYGVPGMPADDEACVVGVRKPPMSTRFVQTDMKKIEDPRENMKPVLAHLGTTGCPSLVMSLVPSLTGARIREYAGIVTNDACDLADPVDRALDDLVVPRNAVVVGQVRLDPLGPNAEPGALAFDTGIYTVGAAPTALYVSDRPIASVQQGDVDGDGDLDTVASGSTKLQREQDLDVLLRTDGSFLRRRIDTTEDVSLFMVGDYDGDAVTDVVYTERAGEQEQLMMVWGTRDAPLPPTSLGRFMNVVGLCPVQVRDSVDRDRVVQDLVAIDIDPTSTVSADPTVTILHGSPERTLQSYIDPRSVLVDSSASLFVSAVAGSMFDGSASSDVLTLEMTDTILGSETGRRAKLWPFRGTEPGTLLANDAIETEIGDCPERADGAFAFIPPRLCVEHARFLPWRIDDRDVVLGIDDGRLDGGHAFVVIDPRAVDMTGQAYGRFPVPSVELPRESRPWGLVAVDLRGDAAPELAASFVRTQNGVPVGADTRICTIDATGAPTECPSISTLVPELASARCHDAIVADIAPSVRGAPRAAPSLVLLCVTAAPLTTRVYRIDRDGDALDAHMVAEMSGFATRLRAGDVTGDGLTDLVIVERTPTSTELRVFPHCEVTDPTCERALAATVEEPAP